jgi:uncharacterized membrane protein YsdA (DUF1294 family)/cold shock CspA family protein
MKKSKGKITAWHDGKGYGFITPMTGGDRTFVHIKAFTDRGRRPVVGDVVTYSVAADSRGRPRAGQVAIAGITSIAQPRRLPKVLYPVTAAVFLLVVGGAVVASALPASVLLVYLVFSSVTFAAYAFDKSAARTGAWRTSEKTLHLLALAGGWPGALIAQGRLRHKSRKQSFQAVFRATVVLNCAAFAWLLTPEGARAWQAIVTSFA